MAQPQTMEQLIQSLYDIQRNSAPKVIGTLATRSMQELGSSQRAVALRYQQDVMAVTLAVGEQVPGNQYISAFQTDQWYRTHDIDGHYASLVAYIQRAALSSR